MITPVNALQRTATLLGNDVVSPTGDRIGSIADLIIDCGSGRISHLIVRTDHRVLYLPWAAINFTIDADQRIVLTLAPESGRWLPRPRQPFGARV